MPNIQVLTTALLVAQLLALPQQHGTTPISSRLDIQIENRRDHESTVKLSNTGPSAITAASVSLRRFASDGSVRMAWTRYYDSLVTEAEKPVLSGGETTLHFGTTTENGPADELTVGAVVYEDGVSLGDPESVSRLLTRRRTVRNALIELLKVGDQITSQNTDLARAEQIARRFSEEQEKRAVTPYERNALVESIDSFADNMRLNYHPGYPIFRNIRGFYVAKIKTLSDSRPGIDTAH